MKNYSRYMPEGVRDYVGAEAALKERIQSQMKKLFTSYNYHLIETPSFEYLDVFTVGEESYQQPSLYKFINRQGEMMALRSDMTRSIARVVCTQKDTIMMPQRFCYMANSFRYPELYQGKLHEFTQGGIELIGKKGIEADAEVIELAIEALKSAGITDFSLHIGSSAFLECVLEELGLGEKHIEEVYKAIDKKEGVKLKNILKEAKVAEEIIEILLELIQCSGKIELLRRVGTKLPGQKLKGVLAELENLYECLEEYGVSEEVLFDFSLLSYGKYYTGMMFQVFTHDIGSALVEGGRYDHLLREFGRELPAVGFGVHINLVLQKLLLSTVEDKLQEGKTLVLAKRSTRKVAYEVSKELRKAGVIVENSLADTLEEALVYAKACGMSKLLYFTQGENVEVHHLINETVQNMTIREL